MTVMTDNSAGARTNVVAVLRKHGDVFGDWEVLSRPSTADASLLPETAPGWISSRTLADTFSADPDLWASVDE